MNRFGRVVVVCVIGAVAVALVVAISRKKRSKSVHSENIRGGEKRNDENHSATSSVIVPVNETATSSQFSSEVSSLYNAQSQGVADEFTICGLFGGAIQCLIPARCSDIAQFRQVPDHQFVYEDPELDQSIIVEINTYQDQVSDRECATFFWNNLIEDTEAKEEGTPLPFNPICPHLPREYFKCGLIGLQQISKYRDEATNTVQVCMAVIRLKQYTSDICIFVNTPLKISQNSSTAGLSSTSEQLGPQILNKLLESFEIKDYSIFG